jgi:hypothetical protein
MLKAELERRLKESDLKVAELRIDNTKITSQAYTHAKEVERLNDQLRFTSNQIKLIDHSLHTMIQVKHPENKPMDLTAGAVNTAWTPDSEEKRFLLFLRDLCTTGVHSVEDLFNHLGRS